MMHLRAVACLSLSVCLWACAAPAPTRPPLPVKIQELVPVPAWCFQLEPVSLLPNSSSDDVEAEQHRAILAYESRLVSCRELNAPSQIVAP